MTTPSLTEVPAAPPRVVLRSVAEVKYVTLTWRQIDILRELLLDGASNRDIGERLSLVEDTVKTHFKTLFSRVGGGNRVSLIIGILRGRIVILDPPGRRVGF